MANKVNRAAQFLPFDALKGLSEKIAQVEEELSRVDKIDLSDYQKEVLDETLQKLRVGSVVNITFYFNCHYVQVENEVDDINLPQRYISINHTKIYFSDIYSMDIVEN